MELRHFILLLFIFNTKAMLSESASTSGNETDRLALLVIRDQIDPLGALSSWNDSLHFCKWKGVTCSRQHQRITVLNLERQKLTGSLSPSIGNLSFLSVINLASNNLNGQIPPEIGNLFRLKHINLSQNSFLGDIPANISHCRNLRIANLNQNMFVGRIPLALASLPKLERLHISGNNITGTIPPALANISTLTTLSLSRNNLIGSIPADLGQLANLTFLQISQNRLSGMIPSSLYNLSLMNIFSVADNKLHGNLPPNLGLSFPKLEMLYVGSNQFTGTIPKSIVNASGLSELYFTNNDFSGCVPENLGSLSSLVKINLGRNHLGGMIVNDLSFLTSMINCTKLELLGIHVNNFNGLLPHSITNLSSQLQLLTTGGNAITGTIPPGIENLVNLNVLGFENNFFTGTIPVGVGKLQKLEVLALLGNKFSGTIPTSFGNLSLLNRLHLAGNDLSGGIPSSLGNCQQLQILQLSRNNLNGSIPGEIMNLPSLSISLTFAHNSLEGSLPQEVGNLKNLGRLDASRNKLSGKIPRTLANCLSLVYLNLSGNSFHGTIPQQLSNLRGLQELDLSRNNLSGQIPRYLETFPFLEKLNLSFNDLEGEVPKEGIFKNASAMSALGNIKLCGGVPQLQLPICHVQDSEKEESAPLKLIVPAICVALFVVLIVSIVSTLYWKGDPQKKVSSAVTMEDGHLKLSYKELFQSTDGFSSANLIGEGSYGSVYKGMLDPDKMVVAVKVLDTQQRGISKSFIAECKVLRNIRHRNLIKIFTSCSSLDHKGNDFKALVIEFMPNGNLDVWLHPKAKDKFRNLNLKMRLSIAHNVASALCYLHHDCETPIVHCDLKPSNVLLDEDMNAHVSDFGLARFISETPSSASPSETTLTGLKGTIGYVAPEYGINGQVSTYSDVYSYGILVLEMFTGKRPTDDLFKDGLSLNEFAKTAFPDRIMEIMDPALLLEEEKVNYADSGEIYDNVNVIVAECLVSLVGIGLQCSVGSPTARMNMRDVVTKLHVIKDSFI